MATHRPYSSSYPPAYRPALIAAGAPVTIQGQPDILVPTSSLKTYRRTANAVRWHSGQPLLPHGLFGIRARPALRHGHSGHRFDWSYAQLRYLLLPPECSLTTLLAEFIPSPLRNERRPFYLRGMRSMFLGTLPLAHTLSNALKLSHRSHSTRPYIRVSSRTQSHQHAGTTLSLYVYFSICCGTPAVGQSPDNT